MGRRGANQTAVFFAAVGTLGCGLSTNMEMLIAARFVSLFLLVRNSSHYCDLDCWNWWWRYIHHDYVRPIYTGAVLV